MNIPTTVTKDSVNIQELMAETDKNNIESRKSAKLKREHHHRKVMAHKDQSIRKMEKQHSKMGSAIIFGFFMDLFSQFVQKLDLLAPGLGTGLSKVGQFLQAMNPFQRAADQAGIDAKKFDKLAEQESGLLKRAEERATELGQHRQIQNSRLEKALHELQESQEATVRV